MLVAPGQLRRDVWLMASKLSEWMGWGLRDTQENLQCKLLAKFVCVRVFVWVVVSVRQAWAACTQSPTESSRLALISSHPDRLH